MPFRHSLLQNNLGNGADALVAAAREMPQLVTLCGIQPEQEDIDFSGRSLNAGDAKLLAFDLSKNQMIKSLKCAPAHVPDVSAPCQHLALSVAGPGVNLTLSCTLAAASRTTPFK